MNEYKRTLLEALMREKVSKWEQVEKGLAEIDSPFLPNPNKFAKDCKGSGQITGAWGTGAHRIYEPERLLVDFDARERAEKAGEETIGNLRGIFK